MAEDNLPKRARELRSRLEELDRKHKEASDAYMKQLKERTEVTKETLHSLIESGGTEAVEEYLQDQDREDKQALREIAVREKKLLGVLDEVDMVRVEAHVEGTRLRFDVVKQQATFSVVAVAGMTAVTEGVLPEKLFLIWLFWTSIGLLLTTIVLSLFLLYLESFRIQAMLESGRKMPEGGPGERIADFLYFSALGFPLAIITFLIFAIYNFA